MTNDNITAHYPELSPMMQQYTTGLQISPVM